MNDETTPGPGHRAAPAAGAAGAGEAGTFDGRLLDGQYRVGERLGAGGMGVVHRARHELPGIDFAVKFLAPGMVSDDAARRRFIEEARVLSRLDHPGFVRLRHAGEDGGRLYLVMDLVKGVDLGRILETEGPLAEARAGGLAIQVLEALDAAHMDGVVHRDLKPSNVLVDRAPDGTERARVADLGVARVRGDCRVTGAAAPATAAGHAVGTVGYMAPEQIRGEADVDGRADLFAVGALLHELLSGAPAFAGDSALSIAMRIQHGDPEPLPAAGARAVSAPMRAVVARALARDREERFQNAAAFANAIRGALRGVAPTGAPAAATAGRPSRARVVAAAAIASAAVAVALLAASRTGGPGPPPGGGASPTSAPPAATPSRDPVDEAASRALEVAAAALAADPFGAIDSARRALAFPRGILAPDTVARAAVLEGDALTALAAGERIRADEERVADPAASYARALRAAAATPSSLVAMARLGEAFERDGDAPRAAATLAWLAADAAGSPEERATRPARVRALAGTGRLAEARRLLTLEPRGDAAETALAAVLEDLSPLVRLPAEVADVWCAFDGDGDGRDEIVTTRADGALTSVALLAEGAAATVLRPPPDGGAVVDVLPLPATGGAPPFLVVVTRAGDAASMVRVVPRRDGPVVGAGVRVTPQTRCSAVDLDGDGTLEVIACHTLDRVRPISAYRAAAGDAELREVPLRLVLPATATFGHIDLFGAASATINGADRVVLATGFWKLLGAAPAAAMREGEDGWVLDVPPRRGDATVESIQSDDEGGVVFTVSHRPIAEPAMLARLAGASAPGIRRLRDGDPVGGAPLLELPRGIGRLPGEGGVRALRERHVSALARWSRGGARRWLAAVRRDAPPWRTGMDRAVVVVDERRPGEPLWLPVIQPSVRSRRVVAAGDFDGDGAEDLAWAARDGGAVVVAGLRRVPAAAAPEGVLDLPGGGLRAAGTDPEDRVLAAAARLRALGMDGVAADAYEDALEAGAGAAGTREAFEGRVLCLARAGRFEDARAALGGAREVGIPDAVAQELAARVAERQGLPDAALAAARRAVGLAGASGDEVPFAAAILARLDGLDGGVTLERAGQSPVRIVLPEGVTRTPLMDGVAAGDAGFRVSFEIRFVEPTKGIGVVAGLVGGGPALSAEIHGASGAVYVLSHTELTPGMRSLLLYPPGAGTPAATVGLPAAEAASFEPGEWHTVEISVVPRLDTAVLRLRVGEGAFRVLRLDGAAAFAGARGEVGAWLFRYPVLAGAATVEIRRAAITTW